MQFPQNGCGIIDLPAQMRLNSRINITNIFSAYRFLLLPNVRFSPT